MGQSTTRSGTDKASAARLAALAAGAVVAAYALLLIRLGLGRRWLVDAAGAPIVTDFIAPYSAGKLGLQGHALQAYDGRLQHAAELAVVGHPFAGYYGWPYPPLFLVFAAGLAALPYAFAFLVWMGSTLALFAGAVGAIARRRDAVLFALATPWVLSDLIIGQNGFLTAGLIGLALLNLERRPALAGLCLGLLTYKPHFGLLFPLALAAAGRWRTLAWAASFAIALNLGSSALFGFDTFAAFLRGLSGATRTLVVEGAVGWNRLQSIYGAVRWLGGTDSAAWIAQGAVSLASGLGVIVLWRRKAPLALQAAGLAAATALATPYLFTYDQTILAVALAFLYRHGPFDRLETGLATLAALCPIGFLLFDAPVGVIASLAVAGLVARRVARRTAPAEALGADLAARAAA
jgi:hypothetical protein